MLNSSCGQNLQENDTAFSRPRTHGQGKEVGFFLNPRGPWASCTREHLGFLKCGKSFGVSPEYSSFEFGPCLLSSVLSPTISV